MMQGLRGSFSRLNAHTQRHTQGLTALTGGSKRSRTWLIRDCLAEPANDPKKKIEKRELIEVNGTLEHKRRVRLSKFGSTRHRRPPVNSSFMKMTTFIVKHQIISFKIAQC